MPSLRTYRVFICHAWDYNDDYYRLVDMLKGAPNFSWKNLSVPEHDPFPSDEKLKYNLHAQMRDADVFLVLSGMYVAHHEWLDYEITFARRIGRPIIGIKPWGSQVVPVAVQKAADTIVGWNSNAIVTAIRNYALPVEAG